jgi:hypothetical protein
MFNKIVFGAVLVYIQLLFSNQAFSQQNSFFPDVPDSLKKNANAVLLDEQITVDIKSTSQAHEHVEKSVLVLNDDGQSIGNLNVSYEKYMKVSSISYVIFDKTGAAKFVAEGSDISDQGASEDDEIDSHRLISCTQVFPEKPYLVKLKYDIDYSNFTIFEWVPAENEHESVLHATYTVNNPAGYKYNFFSALVDNKEKENQNQAEWEVNNLPAIDDKGYGAYWQEQFPNLFIAPEQFIMGVPCNADNWKDYGLWTYQLWLGRNILPEATQAKIVAMTQGENAEEKIKTVYNFLKANTRYFGIQLGVGGFQTLPASFVCQNGYGDCKALTNYLQALLSAAGIASYPALVNGGENIADVNPDVPCTQFNHVILAVPIERDTFWLECTNQDFPFGFINSFTDNRHALLITPQGGYLVKTPSSNAEYNSQSIHASVQIDPASKEVNVNYEDEAKGNSAFYMSENLTKLNESDRQKFMRDELGIPNFDLKNYSFDDKLQDNLETRLSLKMQFPYYGQFSSDRIFITPCISKCWTNAYDPQTDRKFPVRFSYPSSETDSIELHIPNDFALEMIPKGLSIQKSFGSYSSSYSVKDSTIGCAYHFVMNTYEIPAAQYNDLRTFIAQVMSDEKQKIVFVKKQ